jgi:Skp family chaperone for outer membrane proteins
MKRFLLALLFAVSFGLPASANLKIAVVDGAKAFDAFYKTKSASVRIAAKVAAYKKEYQGLQAEYDNASQQAQSLEDAAKNNALPGNVRQENDQALAGKVQDLKLLEREMEETQNEHTQAIRDEIARSHRELSDEIEKVIAAYAAAEGYDLILDKSAISASKDTLVPFTSGTIFDLTKTIITKLNASAPPG